MSNHVVLRGTVSNWPQCKSSPAGIDHLYFILSHRSEQETAGLPRSVYCRIAVVLAGENLNTDAFSKNDEIEVQGYLGWRKNRVGLSEVILHAKTITVLNKAPSQIN